MNETQIHELVALQRQYFLTNATLNIDFHPCFKETSGRDPEK